MSKYITVETTYLGKVVMYYYREDEHISASFNKDGSDIVKGLRELADSIEALESSDTSSEYFKV